MADEKPKNKRDEGARGGLVFPYPDDEDFFDKGIPKGVLSPSGFGTYKKCARQFQYAYVDGMRKPPGVAMIKGIAIHHGAEVTHKHTIEHGIPLGILEATQAVADDWDKGSAGIEDWKENDGSTVDPGKVKDAAIENFRAYYRCAVPLIKPLAAEKPFACKVGTVPMRGVIDLIDQVPGEYDLDDDPELPPPLIKVVADLKTTKKKWTQQKLDYDNQMTIYSIVEKTDNVRVDLLLDLKSGAKYAPMRTLRSLSDKRLLVEDVEETVDCIKKGIFPRCDPTDWCCTPKWCGFFAICRGPK